jgi:hypothetical protein
MEKAVEVANKGMETRLAGMNEFRDTLKDQAARFTTRDELRSEMTVLSTKIDGLEKFKVVAESKASQSQVNISLFFSVMSLLLSVSGFTIAIIGLL